MLLASKLKVGLFAVVLAALLTAGVSWAQANSAEVEPTAMPSPKKTYDPIRKDAVWERFASICGGGENTRKLFDEMMEDKDQEKAIREAEKSDAATFELYSKLAKKRSDEWSEAFKEFIGRPAGGPGSEKPMQDKSRKVILRRHVLQHFFLGSRALPDKTPDIEQTLTRHPAFIELMTGTEKEPAQKLFLAWLERRTNAKARKGGFDGAMFTKFNGVLPIVRKQIEKEKIEAKDAAAMLTVIGNLGEKPDEKRIEKFLDQRDELGKSVTQQGRIVGTSQLRDVAAGMLLKLYGEDPESYGFHTIETIAWWYGPNPGPFVEIHDFKSDDERNAAFTKFQKWRDEMSKKGPSK